MITKELTAMAAHFYMPCYTPLLCFKGTNEEQLISMSELLISKSLWNNFGETG